MYLKQIKKCIKTNKNIKKLWVKTWAPHLARILRVGLARSAFSMRVEKFVSSCKNESAG